MRPRLIGSARPVPPVLDAPGPDPRPPSPLRGETGGGGRTLEGLADLFTDEDQDRRALESEHQRQVDELYAEIGRLTTQLAWLKKIWPRTWAAHRVSEHPGVLRGYVALIARYPNDKVTTIVLSNQTDLNIDDMEQELARKVFPEL